MPDFVDKVKKHYYSQTLLEECKYEIKKSKMESCLNDGLEPSSSDEYDSESDNGTDNEFDNEPDNESNNETDNKSND